MTADRHKGGADRSARQGSTALATAATASPRLTPARRAALEHSGLDPESVAAVVATALAEDLAYGPDYTTEATVPAGAVAEAAVVPRSPGVLAGVDVAMAVFETVLEDEIRVVQRRGDGTRLDAGDSALAVRGPVRGLLTAERTALNVLCHLSGIATATSAWVEAVAGTGCAIRDSRKTLPGLRFLQKYAVRAGGGVNHRMGLGDAILIKDNHVVAAGSVTAAFAAARTAAPGLPCEVEVTTLAELDAVLGAGADVVLLDNFSVDDCAEAVRRTRATAPGVALEASGGLSVERARAYAETGVDYLAVGGLTHSSVALDLGMDLAAS